ncbi:MAG TPA: hypothetical protein VIF60_19820 [Burkholderiaceae bacterium]
MTAEQILKSEFDAEDGTFLLIARCQLSWDKNAFKWLTAVMYDVAANVNKSNEIPKWIANGFWFCDKWIPEWTSHPNFLRPDDRYYKKSCELIHDLAYFLFNGESPYEDDTLLKLAKG